MNTAPRLLSLDAFRGATIAAMLLVNNPGSWADIYAPLRHAPWHGWTATDLVFPCFLWIAGAAMALSFARRAEEGADRRQLWAHLWRRAALIFGLGLLLAAFPFGLLPAQPFSFATLRIPGVLQRIAVCALAAGAILLRTGWRGQAAWAAGLLAGYWALLAFVPVPGYGAGRWAEAVGSLPWWVDSYLLAGHTWAGAPAPGFDPEGILSTLPAIASTLLGALAGQLLRRDTPGAIKAAQLGALGLALLLAGFAWSRWLPLNKNLWTSSYAVFAAGWATGLGAGFYWLIEVRGWRRWAAPLIIYGMNALALFVLAGLVGRLLVLLRWTDATGTVVTLKGWIFAGLFAPLASPVNASLLYALVFVALTFVVAWVMWRRKWFLKV